MITWLAFVAAAATGAVARSLLGRFPWGTFTVNVTGTFLAGLLTGLEVPRTVLITGFCGAFTTFSTFAFETVRLMEDGETAKAVRYLAATVMTCGAAAGVGLTLGSLTPT